MQFVPDWRDAWKWFSVQALAAIVILPMVWASLPADAKAWVPESWQPWIIMVLAVAGIIGRVIDQNKAPAP